MTGPARITVLMPLYNHAGSVSRALESIARQTVRELRILVLDDGSEDRGPEVVQAASTQDHRIELVRLPHRGIVAALEAGMALVETPFVARMDADDWSAPDRLRAQLAFLAEDDDLAAVDCQVDLEESDSTGAGMRSYIDWLNGLTSWAALRNALLEEAPLVHPATLLRTDAVRRVGGYQDGPWPEDYSLWLRLVAGGYKLGKVPRRLFTWADPPGRLTRNDPRCTQQAMLALKVSMLPQLLPRVGDGVQVWGAGVTGRRLMRHLREAGIPVLRIYDVSPKLIGTSLHGIPVSSVFELPDRKGPMCLVALGRRDAKDRTLEFLAAAGLRSWQDYLFVA